MLMMGVLGNVLFIISSYFGNLGYGLALDLSHVATFIAGFYGGPLTGFISGVFVGVIPGIRFGPMGFGSWLALIGLPLGKGLTGLTAGLIAKKFRLGDKKYTSLLMIPLSLLAYVPEVIFTYVYFTYLMRIFLGGGGAFLFFAVMPKALLEITVIGFLMGALVNHQGFNDFVGRFFAHPQLKTGEYS